MNRETVYRETVYRETVYRDTVYRETVYRGTVYRETVYSETDNRETVYRETIYRVRFTERLFTERQLTVFEYKVGAGVNLLYPKIGEIDPYAMQQRDQSSEDELSLLLDSGLNTDSENGDDVTG